MRIKIGERQSEEIVEEVPMLEAAKFCTFGSARSQFYLQCPREAREIIRDKIEGGDRLLEILKTVPRRKSCVTIVETISNGKEFRSRVEPFFC